MSGEDRAADEGRFRQLTKRVKNVERLDMKPGDRLLVYVSPVAGRLTDYEADEIYRMFRYFMGEEMTGRILVLEQTIDVKLIHPGEKLPEGWRVVDEPDPNEPEL